MIRLVHADITDEARILQWRNDPDALSKAETPRAVTPEEHRVWFSEHALNPTRCRLYIACLPVGFVRLDRMEGSGVEVSIYVEPRHREHGYGAQMLTAALARPWTHDTVWARVRRDNGDAQSFFERQGFEKVETTVTVFHYRRRRT